MNSHPSFVSGAFTPLDAATPAPETHAEVLERIDSRAAGLESTLAHVLARLTGNQQGASGLNGETASAHKRSVQGVAYSVESALDRARRLADDICGALG